MTLATWKIEMQAAARAALIAAVNAMPAPRPAFAWEGETYTPVEGSAFIRESFRPDTKRLSSVGSAATSTIEHRATVALVLTFPAGKGTKPANTAAGLIMAAFSPGSRLERNGCSAWVANVDDRPAIEDPKWFSVPVNIALLGHSNS